MKKIFTLAAVAAFALGASAQQVTVDHIDHSLADDHAGGLEIDIDNDGIKEVIFGGNPNWDGINTIVTDKDGNEIELGIASWMLKWDGSKYNATRFPHLLGGWRSHVIPADFNGDGYVDLYIASGGDAHTANGIYLNDGKGNFEKDARFAILDEEGKAIVAPATYIDGEGNEVEDPNAGDLRWLPRAIDVADFNNDGLLDIVSCGWWLSALSENAMAGVLLNNGDGTYTVTNRDLMGNGEMTYAFALCTIKAYDLNNDGYADFIVQGNVDNNSDVEGEHKARTFMQFINLGAETDLSESPVQFYAMGLEDNGVVPDLGNGNFEVADFNNDGTPDMFVTGELGPDNGWAYEGQLLLGKIVKGELSYTDDQSFVARKKDIRPLNSNNVGTRAIDYNGDGLFDLILPGWCPGMLDGGDATQAGWLLPGSANGLTSYIRIPGSSEQGIFFLDYGKEGELNYTFTGYHGDGSYFPEDMGGRSMVFTKNPWAPAARPDAPTAPKAEVKDHTVTLSWTPAASSQKNVTYEIYLKRNGKVYNGCTSFIGGDNDGVRKVLRDGNAFMNTTLNLNLADGVYEWGVQTISAAQRGSKFAQGGSFVVGNGEEGISNITAATAAPEYFTLDGKRIAAPQQGVIIVKEGNSVKKIVR